MNEKDKDEHLTSRGLFYVDLKNYRQAPGTHSKESLDLPEECTAESHATRAALRNLWRKLTPNPVAKRRLDFQKLLSTSIFAYAAAGGAGCTTVIATLGRLLTKQRKECVIIDGRERSMVPFFFSGQSISYGHKPVASWRAGSEPIIRIISREVFHSDKPTSGSGEHLWYQHHINQIQGSLDHILVDVSDRKSANVEPYLSTGVTLMVSIPDVSSILGAMALKRQIAEDSPESSVICVLNKYDAALSLHREIREWFASSFPTVTVGRSDLVSEAVAEGLTVIDWAPESSVAADFGHVLEAIKHLFNQRCLADHSQKIEVCQ